MELEESAMEESSLEVLAQRSDNDRRTLISSLAVVSVCVRLSTSYVFLLTCRICYSSQKATHCPTASLPGTRWCRWHFTLSHTTPLAQHSPQICSQRGEGRESGSFPAASYMYLVGCRERGCVMQAMSNAEASAVL